MIFTSQSKGGVCNQNDVKHLANCLAHGKHSTNNCFCGKHEVEGTHKQKWGKGLWEQRRKSLIYLELLRSSPMGHCSGVRKLANGHLENMP